MIWSHLIKISDQVDELPKTNSQMYLRIESKDIEKLQQQLIKLSEQQLLKLIVNVDVWQQLNTVLQEKIKTVHLKQSQLMQLKKGDLVVAKRYIAACHDAVSVQHAHQIGCDAIFLSPVNPTATHPNSKVLGWDGFAALAQKSDIPVFALGGVAPADLEQAQKHNAYGLAGIRQFSSI